jgi:dipeptidyl aminopeptidase/acylaminoacyl peptidase
MDTNPAVASPTGAPAAPSDSAPRPAWAARFSAVKTWAVDWARLAPERVLYGCDRTGVAQIYAWDQAADTHTQLTSKPSGVQADLAWLAEDGQTVYYLDDEGGSETGRLVRLPFTGGAPEVVDPSLPPLSIGWVKGLAGGVVLFDGSDAAGYRIYRHEGTGPSRVLYEHKNEAYGDTLSHDHQRLAILTSEQAPNRHWHITVLDAATGTRQAELDDGPDATAFSNAWAPFDGDTRLLYTSNVRGRNLPGIWDVAAGTRQPLMLDLPGEVTGVDWLPDGQGVLLAQDHEGRVQLYTYDLASGTVTALPHSPGTLAPLHVRPDGAIWYNYESAAAVDQVRALEGGQERRLLGGDQALPGTPLESVHFPSTEGASIHGFLGVPPGPGPFPAIVVVHGGPATHATDSYDPFLQADIDEGYAVLTINYRGSSGYGRAHQDIVQGDPGHYELEDMAAARDYLIARGITEPDRVVIRGRSYGGYLTLMALTRQPALWAAGCALVGIADFAMMYEDANEPLRGWVRQIFGGGPEDGSLLFIARAPITRAAELRAPLLIIQGRVDSRCPPRQMEVFIERLRELGKPFQVEWFNGGHILVDMAETARLETVFFDFLRGALGDRAGNESPSAAPAG